MINVSADHLRSILARIEDALVLHDKWREGFQRTLICRLAPAQADLGEHAHEHCAFGHWLYGKSNVHLLSLPAFQTMEATHKSMHKLARRLLEQREAGHLTAVEDYDAYLGAATAFRANILELKQRVAFMLDNIDPLTGAYLYAQMLPALRATQQGRATPREPLALVLIDLDPREINRELGHAAGDRFLQAAISGLRQMLGVGDQIYRVVGAEFVIVVPGRTAAAAEALRAPMLATIADAFVATTGRKGQTAGFAINVVEVGPSDRPEDLLDRTAQRATPDLPQSA